VDAEQASRRWPVGRVARKSKFTLPLSGRRSLANNLIPMDSDRSLHLDPGKPLCYFALARQGGHGEVPATPPATCARNEEIP
jgi:hypothetical protein